MSVKPGRLSRDRLPSCCNEPSRSPHSKYIWPKKSTWVGIPTRFANEPNHSPPPKVTRAVACFSSTRSNHLRIPCYTKILSSTVFRPSETALYYFLPPISIPCFRLATLPGSGLSRKTRTGDVDARAALFGTQHFRFLDFAPTNGFQIFVKVSPQQQSRASPNLLEFRHPIALSFRLSTLTRVRAEYLQASPPL